MIWRILYGGLAMAVLVGGVLLAYGPMTGSLRISQQDPGLGKADFDWQRSAARLRVIAAESHFIGTEAHRKVWSYIQNEAAKNPRVQVERQTLEASYRSWEPFAIATVNNVVARLPGTSGERSVLVVAHYDSVPTGPGTADDGSAVAAMLEVLRIVANAPPLTNDIVFLFADAEEVGSMGASGFLAAQTPEERARIGVVLNFEARGDSGPVVMFETSRNNGGLIEHYAALDSHPVGNSLASMIYRMLDNDTDFSVFRDAGLSGMNFAYFDGLQDYHTSGESDVSPHSIQHQGDQMLELVRRLGDADLSRVATAPVIYFDVLGLFMIWYGPWLAWVLALGCGAGMCLLTFRGVRSGRLRLGRCAAALGITLALVMVAALLAWLSWTVTVWIEPRYALLPGETPYSDMYFIGLLIIAAAVVGHGIHVSRRVARPAELAVGALLPWTVLAVLTGFLAPGVSYFFQWPQLCALGLLGLLLRAHEQSAEPIRTTGVSWLASLLLVPPLVLIVPIIVLLYSAFSMMGIAMVIGLWALWLVLIMPFLGLALGKALVWCLRAGLVVGGLVYFVGGLQREFDTERPSTNSLIYFVDTNQNQAYWVSADRHLDEWTSSILGADARQESLERYFPYIDWDMYIAETPAVREYSAPGLTVLSDSRDQAERHLTLRLVPRLDFSMLELQVSPARLLGVEVAGERYSRDQLQSERGDLVFQFWTPAAAGVDMMLTLAPDQPVTLRLSEVQYDSQATRRLFPIQRPTHMSPYPFGWISDSVRITFAVQL